jgi:hypothetical protein
MSIRPDQIFIRNIPTTSVTPVTTRLGLLKPSSGINFYLTSRSQKPESEDMLKRREKVSRYPNPSTQFSFGQQNIWMKNQSTLRLTYPVSSLASNTMRSQTRVSLGKQVIKLQKKAIGDRLY